MSPPLLRLGLIITYRCNAECRHCFFESGPSRDEVMSLDLGVKAIDEAIKLGAEWVSFTGGEPFLEPELLGRLVEYASGKDVKTEAVSNGYWASSRDTAENVLQPLHDLGLDVLNLSIDDFHQEYVPVEYVRNAYEAALSLDLKIVLMTTTAKGSKITSANIPELLQGDKIQVIGGHRIRDPNALLIETPITPAGRGASITEHDYTLISEVKCSEALRDIGVSPGGDVYPCCGPLAARKILGNVNDRSLQTILEDAQRDPFLSSIRLGVYITGAYTSKCHACVSLVE